MLPMNLVRFERNLGIRMASNDARCVVAGRARCVDGSRVDLDSVRIRKATLGDHLFDYGPAAWERIRIELYAQRIKINSARKDRYFEEVPIVMRLDLDGAKVISRSAHEANPP